MSWYRSMLAFLVRMLAFLVRVFAIAPERSTSSRKRKQQQADSSQRRHSNNDDKYKDSRQQNNDNSNSTSTSDNADPLDVAYKFFESTEKEATRATIKKAYKKMSLKYHPDRNGNSEESNRKMQEINSRYTLLEEEFDRIERVGARGEEDDHPSHSYPGERQEESEESDGEEDEIFFKYPTEAHLPKNNNRKARCTRKRWHQAVAKSKKIQRKMNREKKAQRMREEEMEKARKEREAEIKKEQHDLRSKVKELRKQAKRQEKAQRKQDLVTESGRSKANLAWEEECELHMHLFNSDSGDQNPPPSPSQSDVSFDDIDEDTDTDTNADTINTQSTPSSKKQPKPTNRRMEICTDEITMALRTTQCKIAIGLYERKFTEVQNLAVEKVVRDYCIWKKGVIDGSDEGKINDLLRAQLNSSRKEFFLRGLDEDQNTMLHYAAYYESQEMISVILSLCQQYHTHSEVFLAENIYGRIPLDYCKWGYRKDPSVCKRMEELTDVAREEHKEKNPSASALLEPIWESLQKIDWISLFISLISILMGKYVFGRGVLLSVLICGLSRSSGAWEDSSMAKAEFEWRHFVLDLSIHCIWSVCHATIAIIFDWLPWKSAIGRVLLDLSPFAPALVVFGYLMFIASNNE